MPIKITTATHKYKSYRPWDLMGDGNIAPYINIQQQKIKKGAKKQAEKSYKSVREPLEKSYKSVREPLEKSYKSVREPLEKSYKSVREPLEKSYKSVREPLGKALDAKGALIKTPLAQQGKKTYPKKVGLLTGKEKDLVFYIFKKCQLIGSNETEEVTTNELLIFLKINALYLRNLIFRIVTQKKIVQVSLLKNGRGGWRKFKFEKDIYQQMCHKENEKHLIANNNKTTLEPLDKALEVLPSSSSIYNKTTTNNNTLGEFQLSLEWQSLDIGPLVSIGFTIAHLSQIASQDKLQPQPVQDSIHAFAFDLQENDKAKSIKGDPVNFFMGILRKGVVYNFPSNYESPQDKALRTMLETKKKQQQKKEDMLDELTNIEFPIWRQELKKEELEKIVPEEIRKLPLKSAATSSLKTYFREKILFPRLKKEGFL